MWWNYPTDGTDYYLNVTAPIPRGGGVRTFKPDAGVTWTATVTKTAVRMQFSYFAKDASGVAKGSVKGAHAIELDPLNPGGVWAADNMDIPNPAWVYILFSDGTSDRWRLTGYFSAEANQ